MPSDYVTIKALTQELNNTLSTGKIDKIFMPEKDEISLAIRANGTTYLLAISSNASNPRIHTTNTKKLNPDKAPSFCMHLRKHILGGIINNIYNLNEDRIIVIEIASHNEMRDEVMFKLIFEVMGRYSNIILVNQNDIITDALKQVSFDLMTKRTLLPSAKYSVPEQNKITLSNYDEIEKALHNYTGNCLSNYLCSIISGIAKSTAEEIVLRSNVINECTNLDIEQVNSIIKTIKMFNNIYESSEYKPCIAKDNKTSIDFFVTPYKSLNYDFIESGSLNNAIDNCLAQKDKVFRQQEKTKFLLKAYNSYLNKTIKRQQKAQSKFNETINLEQNKVYGDLILSNLYAMQKGDKTLNCINYYDENQSNISIPLDETLSPQKNAQAYFKKYAKLKRTKEVTSEQLIELNEDIEYLQSIETFIQRASTPQEILEIQEELTQIGALKVVKNKKKQQSAFKPLTYLYKDFIIMVGKNNLQNDKLTFKIANGSDIWIHTKKHHGSHTIIFAEGREIPEEIIQFASEICAAYSQCGNETKIDCDYTQRKNVKRHPNKKPGMVLYTIYNTTYVEPNAHLEFIQK